jgi:hypothetical protein
MTDASPGATALILGAGGAIEALLLGVVVVVVTAPAPAAPCADGVVELVEDVFTFEIALCPTATVVTGAFATMSGAGATVAVTGAFTTMSSAGATVVVAERATVVVVVAVEMVGAVVVVVVVAVVVVAAG